MSAAATPAPLPTPDPEYIIDNIMPSHEIHLMGGPSGGGKTSLTFQMLCDLAAGRNVFGNTVHPVPFCYVACDRSVEATRRTLSRLDITLDIPLLSLIDSGIDYNIDSVVTAATRKVPDLRFLVIDAIGSLTPEGKINDYRKVQQLLCRCTKLCRDRKLTMLGQGHSTKTKEGEEFKNPRQRFLGSVAWGGFSETMFYIEPTDASNPVDPTRRVMVLPRNSASLMIDYTFDSTGKLVPISDVNASLVLDVNLLKIPYGTELSTALIVSWGEASAIPKRTVERWIDENIRDSRIERVKRGVYKRVHPS